MAATGLFDVATANADKHVLPGKYVNIKFQNAAEILPVSLLTDSGGPTTCGKGYPRLRDLRRLLQNMKEFESRHETNHRFNPEQDHQVALVKVLRQCRQRAEKIRYSPRRQVGTSTRFACGTSLYLKGTDHVTASACTSSAPCSG